MGFTTKLKSDWVDGEDRIVTTFILSYYDKKTDKDYEVPAGFYSDGASLSKVLWPILGHPFNSDVREAAVLHDWFYYSGIVSRREADRMFRQAMKACGANFVKRYLYWSGVRLGGWVPWNNYRARGHYVENFTIAIEELEP